MTVLVRTGGAASARRLQAEGVTPAELRRALTGGSVVRLRRGAYALPEAAGPTVAAVRLGGVVAGTAAARLHGFDVLDGSGPVDVIVPRSWGHARWPGVRVRRTDLRPDEQLDLCTSPVRTVIDCARWLSLREGVVIADAALRRGLDVDLLARTARAAHGHGSVQIRQVVALSDGRAESVIETCARLIVIDIAASVLPQAWIPGVGRVDLLLDGWLVIEADGFAFHRSRQDYREDRRRATELARLGFTLVRFSYEDVVFRPDWVRTVIAEMLLARRASRQATR